MKIWFEKHIKLLGDKIVLVGNSLGGIFLTKYLSENKFPKNILSLYLVAPPFDNTIPDEELVGGFELKEDLSLIEDNCKKIYLLFSENDNVVPLSHSKKYKDKLPSSKLIVLNNKNGHFQVEEFPELVELIKKDLKEN